MEDILHGLNNAQRSAVASPAAVLQVLAPPGSGKTKTLTARVAYLVACKQLRPWNIIVCTFTVKAASEMKERITSFVGADVAKQLKLGTFHSVALRYLKSYGQYIGLPKDFNIADSADSKAILKRIIKRFDLSIEPGQALGRISSRKAKGGTADPEKPIRKVEEQEFDRLYDEYESTLAASKLLDYDDILLRCCFLLRSHPQCVANVEAVLIDEFQDTNNIQYDLMSLFAQKLNVITIVGDPDQSIYGFRSAEIKNLSRMKRHWPDTLTINLEENYRSSGAILHAAQNIIEQDQHRPPKKLQATHSYGLRPVLRKLPSAYDEAEWLVSEIKRVQAMSGSMVQADDFAILLRSAALSRAIEAALGNAGVAYRMVGGLRFYDRVEVKLMVDYLRVISQPDYSEAVERIVNVPPRRVGEETVKKLREEAHAQGTSFWTLILDVVQGRRSPKTKLNEPCRKGLASFVNVIISGQKKVESWKSQPPSLVDLINLVAQKIDFQAYLKTKFPEEKEYEARWGNVEELMAQAADLSSPGKLNDLVEAERLPTLDDMEQSNESAEDILSVFLANIALASAEKKAEDGEEQARQVTISTIHAAKGLEWPVVFIPACFEGSIPHSRADDNDEERRLLYVGMTRAQALLYLSCPLKNTQKETTTMSSFLTHPGAATFFEEHGPSLPLAAVTSLSTTLGRICPAQNVINELKKGLERDEDNFWPLNGEETPEQLAKWDRGRQSAALPGFISAKPAAWAQSGSITMQQPRSFSTASSTMPAVGFTSVASRYDELMEQSQLRKVDERATDMVSTAPALKARKRQIEGQGTIASFFAKKNKPEPVEAVDTLEQNRPTPPTSRSAQPLRELPNGANTIDSSRISRQSLSEPSYKLRSTPMVSRPDPPRKSEHSPKHNKYVFLSSSPVKEEISDKVTTQHEPEALTDSVETGPINQFRPATTLHATTMAQIQPQRRTLGMRRSLHGWSARGR
jgi:DNA helicase-2/ATP-dependent DNA helicase PcrA